MKVNDQVDTLSKRTAILESALDLIAKHGFHGTPTSKIATGAGAGVGSIYRYFKSKDELIQELFNHVAERTGQEVLKYLHTDASIKDQFIQISTNLFIFLTENPKVFAFMEQYFNSPYGLSQRRDIILNELSNKKGIHPLHDVLENARLQQLTKDLPFHILGALSFGPIIFLVRDIHTGLIENIDKATITRIIEACWDSIKR